MLQTSGLICFGSEMSGPLFPDLLPRMTDPLWFSVDKPCDDEDEVSKLEEEQLEWVGNFTIFQNSGIADEVER